MFFADRARAFAEVRRVLRRGGMFIFNVWDRIEENEFALHVTEALAGMFPADPPRFMARVPHGYHDIATIRRDLAAGGFHAAAQVSTLAERSRAATAHIPAVAFCQGTPLRNEIEARDVEQLSMATSVAEAAIAAKFGHAAVDGKIQAHVVQIEVLTAGVRSMTRHTRRHMLALSGAAGMLAATGCWHARGEPPSAARRARHSARSIHSTKPADSDADLTLIKGHRERARGQVIYVAGRC